MKYIMKLMLPVTLFFFVMWLLENLKLHMWFAFMAHYISNGPYSSVY